MGIFSKLKDFFAKLNDEEDSQSSFEDDFSWGSSSTSDDLHLTRYSDFDEQMSYGVNPATGLPMMGPAIDVAGNLYGVDDSSFSSSSFCDDWGHSSFCDDWSSSSFGSSFSDSSFGSSWND